MWYFLACWLLFYYVLLALFQSKLLIKFLGNVRVGKVAITTASKQDTKTYLKLLEWIMNHVFFHADDFPNQSLPGDLAL